MPDEEHDLTIPAGMEGWLDKNTCGGELVETAPGEQIRGFFCMDGAEQAIAETGFTLREEVTILIENCRSENPKIALMADRQWRSLLKELGQAGGMFGNVRSERVDALGNRQTVTAKALMGRIKHGNEREREPVLHDHYEPQDSATTPEKAEARADDPDT